MHYLGIPKRSYDEGLDPFTVGNLDETHMVMDMDNNHVLDIQRTQNITYADVSSGKDCFTVCFRITGAEGGKIEAPLVIFQNPKSSYPVAGTPDDLLE